MITDRTFLSFLNCRRKAFLQAIGSPGEQPDIERVQLDLDALYRQRALKTFLGACPSPFPLPPDIDDPVDAEWEAVE